MANPTVTFVVPCYKLAHLLPECLRSILAQTYADFEILVMDDCSPDNTAEIANSFTDERVRYIRNATNLGPLRNYNAGIAQAAGKYVWLISADDLLRSSYVLEKYVSVMEASPNVGYAFCPGVGLRDGRETGVLSYSVYAKSDRIVPGHKLLKDLLNHNFILAASALVRKECYDTISMFPLDIDWAGKSIDMVWGGDWYLWCAFALSFDIAYFEEPMVCYREHDLSMTNHVTRERIDNCCAADIAVPWLIGQRAKGMGFHKLAKTCMNAMSAEYVRHYMTKEYTWLDKTTSSSMSMGDIELTLGRSTEREWERKYIRAWVSAGIADVHRVNGDIASARTFYKDALRRRPWMPKAWLKWALCARGVANWESKYRRARGYSSP